MDASVSANCARQAIQLVTQINMLPRILIAIIAYNEEDNLRGVIADLRGHCDYDLAVIDNASTDRRHRGLQ